jgi:hypothetical protein
MVPKSSSSVKPMQLKNRDNMTLIKRRQSFSCYQVHYNLTLWQEKKEKKFVDLLSLPNRNNINLPKVQPQLLTLDGPVYVADKEQGCTETYAAEHEKEAIADAGHVTEEERSLHKTRHIWSCIVIIQAVAIDE